MINTNQNIILYEYNKLYYNLNHFLFFGIYETKISKIIEVDEEDISTPNENNKGLFNKLFKSSNVEKCEKDKKLDKNNEKELLISDTKCKKNKKEIFESAYYINGHLPIISYNGNFQEIRLTKNFNTLEEVRNELKVITHKLNTNKN